MNKYVIWDRTICAKEDRVKVLINVFKVFKKTEYIPEVVGTAKLEKQLT